MPHSGKERPEVEDASAILAARSFMPRPAAGAAAASAAVAVDDSDLVLAGRAFAARSTAPSSSQSAIVVADAQAILAVRSFLSRQRSSSSSGSGGSLASYPKGAAWPGGGTVLTVLGDVVRCTPCQAPGTIVEAEMEGDGSTGSATVEVWKVASGAAPATNADKISGSNPITITAGTNSIDTTLTGWTKTVALGDRIAFKLLTVSGFTWLRASIKVAV